jgi:hypothetical protein
MSDLLTPVLDIPYANGDDPLGNVDVAMGNLAARVEAILTQHAYKNATQQVVSSTTLVDITDLNFNIVAGVSETRRYKFQGVVLYTGPSAGDMKINLRFPTVGNSTHGIWIAADAAAAGAGTPPGTLYRLQGDVSIVVGADPTIRALYFEGVTTVTEDSADTARLQFAQSVSNATPTVIQIGSHLIAQRLL